MKTNPPTQAFPYPSLTFDVAKLLDCHARVVADGCVYKMGGKVAMDTSPEALKAIDCSGYVRWLIYKAAGIAINDGSYNQREQIVRAGFKKSTRSAGKLKDGIVRIAFLSPQQSDSGVGHVALILNGETLESHGSKGPNRRPWTGRGWQEKASVFVLTKP